METSIPYQAQELKFFQKFKIFREIRRFIIAAKTIFTWNFHCKKQLEHTESLMLANVKTSYKKFFVEIGNAVGSNDRIWTLSMNTDIEHNEKVPMVLLHGYVSALAFWMLNLDSFASERAVYAIDLLGFGKSSRPTFSSDPLEIENQFVNFLEKWRETMRLEKMILLGHSFGAWICSLYALKYPERIEHLILADPWGYTKAPCPSEHSLVQRVFLQIFTKYPPFNVVRAFGPFAPLILRKTRPDITGKFESIMIDRHKRAISEYIYHCNSVRITGEEAFHRLLDNGPWPVNPICERMRDLHCDVPMTFIYGAKSWIDSSSGNLIKESRPNSYTHIEIVDNAGHKVFSDDEFLFNSIVINACKILRSNRF